jgi:hypothetical protein
VLDVGLRGFISGSSLTLPSGYRNDLHGRISFLSDSGFLTDAVALRCGGTSRDPSAP